MELIDWNTISHTSIIYHAHLTVNSHTSKDSYHVELSGGGRGWKQLEMEGNWKGLINSNLSKRSLTPTHQVYRLLGFRGRI